MTPVAIYIHIPYCVRKCLYCDFLSFGVGEMNGSEQEHRFEVYVNRLLQEIDTYGQESITVKSVFFGGGTPSVLPATMIESMLCKLKSCFPFEANAEITLEANPGTVTEEKLAAYREAGINRISFGLQSTVDRELQTIGRIHDYATFLENYKGAAAAGFDNINIDLMSALPGQTLESYRSTLERVLALEPQHISAYSLMIEEGTPFYERYGNPKEGAGGGFPPLPDEDTERDMYALTRSMLAQHGYEQYEISNYAKRGFSSLHNITYWKREPYIGLGLGASSFYGGKRYKNETSMDLYLDHCIDPDSVVVPDREDAMEETLFLGLRMNEGVNEEAFRTAFGTCIDCVYPGVTDRLVQEGLVVRENGCIRLTEKGMDLSNYVSCEYVLKSGDEFT